MFINSARLRTFPALAIVGVLSALSLTACNGDESVQAQVVRVVDGDTFEAEYGGATKMVRLLNIDTPETKHPNKIVECQGPEATEFLKGKLSEGSTVELRFDEEKTDRFDRVLAAAFVGDELINASIARAGLGVAEIYGANEKYYEPVKAAQDEAAENKAGIYQEQLACSPTTLAEQQIEALAGPVEPGAAATSGEIAAAASTLGTAIAAASVAQGLLNDGKGAVIAAALGGKVMTGSSDRLAGSLAAADSRHSTLSDRAATVKAEEKRKAAEAKAKAKAKAEAKAKAKAAEKKRVAEAKRLKAEAVERERAAAQAAERAAADAAARAAAEAEAARRYTPPAPAYEAPKQNYEAPAPAPAQQNPYPGYNGPRCYAPGGKSWTPCPGR
ncbi:thermonuclease family protein [Arthrobacter sp. Marseille-P9274]|uniref:thermonuclease family protein n=1 Tax=Arthrobacter sp. Marseille-P9274 TaxID=2866572 RepID=UPI0021C76C05|nr:thermonuclease family protein [Arthrobacter sp. Marseille-P9274]